MILSCFSMALDTNTCILYAHPHSSKYGMEEELGANVSTTPILFFFFLFLLLLTSLLFSTRLHLDRSTGVDETGITIQ